MFRTKDKLGIANFSKLLAEINLKEAIIFGIVEFHLL